MDKLLRAMTIALVVATAAIAVASCIEKEADLVSPEAYVQNAMTIEVYDLALRFQTDEGITETTVYFYDADLVQVAEDIVEVPASDQEVKTISFVSGSKPLWVYAPGVQNYDERTGMVPLSGKGITTKSEEGDGGVTLLVIRRE